VDGDTSDDAGVVMSVDERVGCLGEIERFFWVFEW